MRVGMGEKRTVHWWDALERAGIDPGAATDALLAAGYEHGFDVQEPDTAVLTDRAGNCYDVHHGAVVDGDGTIVEAWSAMSTRDALAEALGRGLQAQGDPRGGAGASDQIIPGNVGSLDDVPTDWVKEGGPNVDDEGT